MARRHSTSGEWASWAEEVADEVDHLGEEVHYLSKLDQVDIIFGREVTAGDVAAVEFALTESGIQRDVSIDKVFGNRVEVK